jgi:hypothetical protein
MHHRTIEVTAMFAYGLVFGSTAAVADVPMGWTIALCAASVMWVGPKVRRWARIVTTPVPQPTHDDI